MLHWNQQKTRRHEPLIDHQIHNIDQLASPPLGQYGGQRHRYFSAIDLRLPVAQAAGRFAAPTKRPDSQAEHSLYSDLQGAIPMGGQID
jgi:hypothetical protein